MKLYVEDYQFNVREDGYRSKKNIVLEGAAGFDMSASTGTFKTPTGTHTLAGPVVLSAATTTTGIILSIPNADALTTGSAISVASNSSSASTRSLITVTNSNVAATATTVLAITQVAGTGAALFVQNGGSAAFTGASNSALIHLKLQNASDTGTILSLDHLGTGLPLYISQSVGSNSALPAANFVGIQVITAGVADGYIGAIRLNPTYNAATAQTVTRHNYIDVLNPTVGGVGPAALTDAAVLRFDAAAGTHKAVDGASTKTSPGTVTAWVKININGTIHYIPAYSSKTS